MRKVLFHSISLLVIILAFALASCHREQPESQADPLTITRLDSTLFAPDGVELIYSRDPHFADLWARVLGVPNGVTTVEYLSMFAADSAMRALEDSVLRVYPCTNALDQELQQAFEILHERMDSIAIPDVYYYNSGFNASFLLADSTLGIGLDRYLGSMGDYYTQLGIPKYLQRRMEGGYIVPQAIQNWVDSEMPLPARQQTILDHMLHEGKLLYIVKSCLPKAPDSITLGFSSKQLKWLMENEEDMWVYLSEKKLLYEHNNLLITQFTRPAPFTNAFGQDSPGQAAVYIGYRIVNSYMERNPKTPWRVLMLNLTSQQIITGAHYKPQ